MITYNASPLPFQGQKRRFIGKFRQILSGAGDFERIVDVFGGSGLLAHNAKQIKPNAEVVYNDFDNFRDRLAQIGTTNKVLSDVREVLAAHGIKKHACISAEAKAEILGALAVYELAAPLDYFTLSASLLFSGNYAKDFDDLAKRTLYSNAKKGDTDYSAEGYLEGVTCVRADCRDLIGAADPASTLLLLDPPYLSTDASRYTDMEYWRLSDYLGLVEALRGFKFVYFTSSKSAIVQLTEHLDATIECYADPFKNCRVAYSNAAMPNAVTYTDIMVDNL